MKRQSIKNKKIEVKVDPFKNYQYHKNLKMGSAIKEKMEKNFPSYNNKYNEKNKENTKVSEDIIPNSNKDNRIKAYEELNSSSVKFKGKPVFQSKNSYHFNDTLKSFNQNKNSTDENNKEKKNNKEYDSRWEIIEEKIIGEINAKA